jgi:hypothetical protein
MRFAIDPGDRKLLIITGVLFAVISILGILVWRPQANGPTGFPSTYSTGSSGAEAAYLLLKELGCRVERWTRPPADLPEAAQGVLLVLAEPVMSASAEERSMVRAFLNRGGQVLATGFSGANLLFEDRVHATRQPEFAERNFRAELPAPLTRDAPEITLQSVIRWRPPRAGQQRFYGDAEGPVIVSYRVGKGQVIWWAGSAPLTNHGLRKPSNLALFLNSLGLNSPGANPLGLDGSTAKQTRVLWDEYFHGQRMSLWAYLGQTPVPWALVQFSLLALAALFTYGRRSGHVRPPVQESRLSPLEFIETLGGLYQNKGAARESLETVYHHFRLLLLPRLLLPPSASPDEIARGVRQRLGWAIPGFWETLQRCERGVKSAGVRDREALYLIQELHDYARRFRLGNT